MQKLVVANWKAYPKTMGEARALVTALEPAAHRSRAQAVFCPPTSFLAPLATSYPALTFGAQDAFGKNEGAYTGAVTPAMLKSIGARFVILGHSERRANFNETDADIAAKVELATATGLTAILCVGEPLAVRRKGLPAARAFVAQQLKKDIKKISSKSRLVIAYEPIWAISTSGSGKQETPEDATEMIASIKKSYAVRVLYGGSVNGKNARDFLSQREIDGLLVGRASLDPKEFGSILGDA